MKKIITFLLLILYNSYIYSQEINSDSLAKKDFFEVSNHKYRLGSEASKNSGTDETSSLNTQTPNTNRDIFQFNKVEATNVNSVVGKADIRVPIYNINFQGLNIPVELIYNSGGIKADQFATEVGLGWSLNTGGQIDKEIVKINDSKSLWMYSSGLNTLYEFPTGYLSTNTADHPTSIPPTTYPADLPDLYHVNFLNLNTSFYLNSNFTPQQITPYNSLKISTIYGRYDESYVRKYGYIKDYSNMGPGYLCSSNPGLNKVPVYLLGYYDGYICHDVFKTYKDVQSIKIINDHYTYDFNDFSTTMPVSSSDLGYIIDSGANINPTRNTEVNRYNNQYYISNITDNLTKKKVLFAYALLPGMSSYERQSITFDVFRQGFNDDYQAPHGITDALNIDYDAYVKKNISKITTDNEIIDFEYVKAREDSKSLDIVIGSPTNWSVYNKDPYLSKIYIRDLKGDIKYIYAFNYTYFDSQCTDYNLLYNKEQCYRLKLNSIVKYSDIAMQKIVDSYTFEYYEDTRLPKIGSYQLDPFGYKSPLDEGNVSYLISDTEMNPGYDLPGRYAKHYINKRVPKRPNLYLYNETQNGLDLSYYSTIKLPALSPVKVNINGFDQSLATLSGARAWSLKSIEYLTKGKQNFNYELNSFDWKGQTISGGGIRIANISLVDAGNTYITQYQYSGGQINNLPIVANEKYAFYTGTSDTLTMSISQNLYGKDILYYGGNVLYENVTKVLPNNGKTVEKFSTISANPLKATAKNNLTNVEYILYNYYFPANADRFAYMKKQSLIGCLLEKSDYGAANNLIKKSEYTFVDNKIDFPIINNVGDHILGIYLEDKDIPYSFAFIYTPSLNNTSITGNAYSMTNHTYTVGSDVKMYRTNISQIKTTDLFNGNMITQTKDYSYLSNNNLLKSTVNNSSGEIYTQEQLYPFEQGEQFNSQMSIDDNVKNMVVGSRDLKNGNTLGEIINKYVYSTNGNINQSEKVKKYTQTVVDKTTYTNYDGKGNVVEYIDMSEIPTVIIWGYNQTKPIAMIAGATYSQVMQSFGLSTTDPNSYLQLDIVKKSDLDVDNNTESVLLSNLDLFRKKPELNNFQITTYIYDPLIGIKSITPPSGIKEFYKYDSTNRLEKVVDANGKVLKEYQYHYKN